MTSLRFAVYIEIHGIAQVSVCVIHVGMTIMPTHTLYKHGIIGVVALATVVYQYGGIHKCIHNPYPTYTLVV